MANKLAQKRERMFDLFSTNLNQVAASPGVNATADLTGIYLCPICLHSFTKDALKSDCLNPLTFEDVPPKKLGGRVFTLTCKKCNNSGGRGIDIHLINALKEMDFNSFSPNAGAPVKFRVEDGEVNGRVDIDASGRVILRSDTKSSNPKHSEKLENLVESKRHSIEGIPFEFVLTNQKADKRIAEVALLRVAYLMAFGTFGYGFIINDNLKDVRQQILNPDKEIISRLTPIQLKFPKEHNGMNMIKSPKNLRCFLVIFDLITPSRTYQFAIPLPAPFRSGLMIYDNIKEELAKGDTTITLDHIAEDDYLRDEELLTYTIGVWKSDILEEQESVE